MNADKDMNCKTIQRKLSAYLDGELNPAEKQFIAGHLESCQDCQQEFALLSEQNKFLQQLETIEPSPDFNQKFWHKVGAYCNTPLQKLIPPLPIFKWIPVPIGLSILIFLFLSFSILSPVFSEDKEMGQAVLTLAKNTLLPTSKSKIIAPLNFASFCDEYCQIICKKNQKMGSGCNYQGCKMKSDKQKKYGGGK